MESPIVVATLVFVSIYFIWYLIRVFADFFLVGIALSSAVLAYYIPNFYPTIRILLKESGLSNLIGMTFLPAQPDTGAIFIIAGLIVALAVLISIPILPFSATYRIMFGVEGPVFKRREAKVRAWIIEEVQRYQQSPQEERVVSDGLSNASNLKSQFKKLGSSMTDFWDKFKNNRFK